MPPHDPADPPDNAQTWIVFTPELLAQTQHELRTPLAAILGHAQLLRRRLEQDEHAPDVARARLDRHAAAIEACGWALARAIDRLADPQEAGDDT